MLRWYRDFLPAAPDDLNGLFAFLGVPPGPPFPEELWGKTMCGVVWCYTGADGQGGGDLRPDPRAVRPARARLGGADPAPGAAGHVRRASTRRATSGTGRRTSSTSSPTRRSPSMSSMGRALPTGKSTMHLYPIDGAAGRVAKDATAWATGTRSGRR